MDLLAGITTGSSWAERLGLNIISYSFILAPIGFIIFITRLNLCPRWFKNNVLIQLFVYGDHSKEIRNNRDNLEQQRLLIDGIKPRDKLNIQKSHFHYPTFFCCFMGLQLSYLLWGILQERIMTTKYEINIGSRTSNSTSNQLITFHDSQFLVFLNRAIAFILSIIALVFNRPRRPLNLSERLESIVKNPNPKPNPPLYEYIFCSFSNIMSSWCQYEALKYVNFPTQVMSKSCKVIPVMLMSTLLMKKVYKKSEYGRAILLSLGMFVFLSYQTANFKKHDSNQALTNLTTTSMSINIPLTWRESISNNTMLSGLLILALYLIFDSFTSNWQSSLFSRYNISEWQMMAATNFYSILLTLTSLYQLGHLGAAIKLVTSSTSLSIDCAVMSLASSIGQLFVFFTIKRFGAVVFAVIMTLRQLFAFILSCKIFTHQMNSGSLFGVCLIFSVIASEIFSKIKSKS